MDVDEVFERIGELGPAQWKLLVLLALPAMWAAFHALVTNFIGTDPGWSCSIDIPDPNSTGNHTMAGAHSLSMLVTDPVKKCQHYENGDCVPQFDTEYTSIVTEWELICSRSSYTNLSQSGYFLGLMIGAWMFGSLADTYGRKKIWFITIVGCIVTGIGYGLSIGFLMFVLFRLLFGMMSQAIVVVGYSLLLEVVGASMRSFAATVIQVFFPIGMCILVILAYFIRSWKILCVVISLTGLGFLSLWKLIPESPRWLLVQGREDQARAVLAKIASGNGRQMINNKLKKPTSQASDSSVSTLDLFKGEVIRRRTVILLVAWFTNCIVYYGLSMNAGSLGGGRYLSLVLSGLVELPGLYVSYYLLNRIGRRWSHGGMLMLGGICCVLWALGHLAGMGESVKLILALLGKCAVSGSFSIIYLYSAELFPTEVRSLGLGVVSVASRLGGVISPLILLLSSVSLGMPMLVMGSLGLLAGFLTLSLPETLDQPLPETLSDLDSH
jgi:MFS family permease